MTITWTANDDDTFILGDVNDDGVVDTIDATLVQRYDAQMSLPEGTIIERGDVNNDGEVDIIDATLIQRYDAGMTVKFPIGEEVTING